MLVLLEYSKVHGGFTSIFIQTKCNK